MPKNTLVGRCTMAYVDSFDAALATWPDASARERGIAAVIEHLAAELVVMNQQHDGQLSAHEAVRLLLQEAQE